MTRHIFHKLRSRVSFIKQSSWQHTPACSNSVWRLCLMRELAHRRHDHGHGALIFHARVHIVVARKLLCCISLADSERRYTAVVVVLADSNHALHALKHTYTHSVWYKICQQRVHLHMIIDWRVKLAVSECLCCVCVCACVCDPPQLDATRPLCRVCVCVSADGRYFLCKSCTWRRCASSLSAKSRQSLLPRVTRIIVRIRAHRAHVAICMQSTCSSRVREQTKTRVEETMNTITDIRIISFASRRDSIAI